MESKKENVQDTPATLEQLSNFFAEITIRIKHLDMQRAKLVEKQVAVLNEIEKRKMDELESRLDKKFDELEEKVDKKVSKHEDK